MSSICPPCGSAKAITEAMIGLTTGDRLSTDQDPMLLVAKSRLSRLSSLELLDLIKLNDANQRALDRFVKKNSTDYLKPVEVKFPLDKPMSLTLFEEAEKSLESHETEQEYLRKIRAERVYLAKLQDGETNPSKTSNDPLPIVASTSKDEAHIDEKNKDEAHNKETSKDEKSNDENLEDEKSKEKHIDLTTQTDRPTTKIHLEKPNRPPRVNGFSVSSITVNQKKPDVATNEKGLNVPNELNISIECLADCDPNDDPSKLLEEERKYWRKENEILKAQKQELVAQLDELKHSMASQKQQNVELAKSLQAAKLKARENEDKLLDLYSEYYKQHDLFEQYHRAFLNLSNFTDLVIEKLEELDANLGVTCSNRFLDFEGLDEPVKTTTIDEENIFVVAAYLKSIERKVDNLLIDSLEE